jgi:hypothetical protein
MPSNEHGNRPDELEQLTKEPEDLAIHDPLTGLYNRRGVDRIGARASHAHVTTGMTRACCSSTSTGSTTSTTAAASLDELIAAADRAAPLSVVGVKATPTCGLTPSCYAPIAAPSRPAAARSAVALSVRSQVKS